MNAEKDCKIDLRRLIIRLKAKDINTEKNRKRENRLNA